MNLNDMIKHLSHLDQVRFRQETLPSGKTVTIVCYMVSDDEIWKTPHGRETRGVAFDESGMPICVPFHKFFNVNEKEITQAFMVEGAMSWGFYVAEKMDGSMVTPYVDGDKVIFKTKKSFYSDVAIMATEFAQTKQNILNFCHAWSDIYTPIFEFTSPDQKIVLDYGEEPQLTLLAMRDNTSHRYASREFLESTAQQFGVPLVKLEDFETLEDILEAAKTREGIEGWVIYTDRDLYKVKTRWYVDRHNLIDIRERDVAEMVFDDTIDDLMANIEEVGGPEAVEKVENIRAVIHAQISDAVNTVKTLGIEAGRIPKGAERAKWVAENAGIYSKLVHRYASGAINDDMVIYERVVDLLKSHTLKNWSLRSVANTNFSQEG